MPISMICKHNNYPLRWIRNIHGDEILQLNARSVWECPECHMQICKNYLYDSGNVSDGYHTFNELYHHRAILFAALCDAYPALCWKSLYHYDLSEKMYSGMFIVGIETPKGQATYHYDIEPYWNGAFKNITERPRAPKWDGHTPDEAIQRIESLIGYYR